MSALSFRPPAAWAGRCGRPGHASLPRLVAQGGARGDRGAQQSCSRPSCARSLTGQTVGRGRAANADALVQAGGGVGLAAPSPWAPGGSRANGSSSSGPWRGLRLPGAGDPAPPGGAPARPPARITTRTFPAAGSWASGVPRINVCFVREPVRPLWHLCMSVPCILGSKGKGNEGRSRGGHQPVAAVHAI